MRNLTQVPRKVRLIGVSMILLGSLAGIVTPSAQAAQSAVPAAVTTQTLPASATAATAWPSDMSGVRFTSRVICVHTNVDMGNFPIDYAAQQFNLRSSRILKLTWSPNCVAAGYSETQFFSVIARWDSSDWHCITTPSSNRTQYWNGMYHWSNHHPSVYINLGNPAECGGLNELDRAAHFSSAAVGLMLGLKLVCGDAWVARVMEYCRDYSRENVPWATVMEGNRVAEIYQNVYGG